MKLLTFAIPYYNSEAYMEKCIESILPGGEDVEILIVDDGSKDRTAEIADRYEREYPTICRAIHQENGGHGEAVNAGIRNATGLYFKVVDSDDWVDQEAYMQILNKLRELAGGETQLDMLLANYVYEKEGAKHKKVMRQAGVPTDRPPRADWWSPHPAAAGPFIDAKAYAPSQSTICFANHPPGVP